MMYQIIHIAVIWAMMPRLFQANGGIYLQVVTANSLQIFFHVINFPSIYRYAVWTTSLV
jgi:hypothetical protein